MKEGEATVEVVRVSWVHARTGIVKKETVVAKGKLHPPEGDGKRWVRKGSVDLGEGGKEVTWESDFVGVSVSTPFLLSSPLLFFPFSFLGIANIY